MKKLLCSFLFIASVFFSCEKNSDNDLSQETVDFTFRADKNDTVWIATKVWGYYDIHDDEFSIIGAKEDSIYFQEEDLRITISRDEIRIGEKIRLFDSELSYVIGGDIVFWSYEKTENNEDSYLIINKLDTIAKQIRGEFEIKLKDPRSEQDNYVTMTNGQFRVSY